MYIHLDVTDETQWADAVAATVRTFGAFDVLVNNAAVLVMKAITDTTLDDFRRVFEVNQAGTFLGVRAARSR